MRSIAKFIVFNLPMASQQLSFLARNESVTLSVIRRQHAIGGPTSEAAPCGTKVASSRWGGQELGGAMGATDGQHGQDPYIHSLRAVITERRIGPRIP
jgi:hypothetical protein